MLLDIVHRKTYSPAESPGSRIITTCLHPRDTPLQKCHSFTSNIPANKSGIDPHSNILHSFILPRSKKEFVLEAKSQVSTSARNLRKNPPPKIDGRLLDKFDGYEKLLHFLKKPEGGLSDEIAFEIQAAFSEDEPSDIWSNAMRLGGHAFRSILHAHGETPFHEDERAVIRERFGTHHDFATLMIAYCRAMDIPARYVSGFYYSAHHHSSKQTVINTPHSWVEVYIPTYGWIGYDPTRYRPVDDNYVTLAIGRNYRDIADHLHEPNLLHQEIIITKGI